VPVRTAPFDPAKHGFAFPNAFVDTFVTLPGGRKIQTAGRCGGMAFAALDYWHAQAPVPRWGPAQWAPSRVPPDGHWLADTIRRRLFDSFLVPSALHFVTWTLAPDDGGGVVRGVTRWTKEDQFDKLAAAVDAGTPVPLGLVVARRLDRIGDNHQVVAYGYEHAADGTRTVLVYDDNSPGQEVRLTSGPHDPGWLATNGARWRGFFVQDYDPRPPRVLTSTPAAAGTPVTDDCDVRLVHAWTGLVLRADTSQYAAATDANRVMTSGKPDLDELWHVVAVRPDGTTGAHPLSSVAGVPASVTSTGTAAASPVASGDAVRLRHVATGRWLTSRAGTRSPVTGQQRVDTTALPTDADATWRVEVDGGGAWTADARVRLVHGATGAALHSHAHAHAPGGNEVTGFAGRDSNDWWSVLALA
jgi:dolichyl-phosphate-mannose--protein O-mannosyl transferase